MSLLFLSVLFWFSLPASHCPCSHPHGIFLVNSSESEANCTLSLFHLCNIIVCGQFLFLRLIGLLLFPWLREKNWALGAPNSCFMDLAPVFPVGRKAGGGGGGCEYYKCECLTLPVCPEFGYDKEGLTRVLSPPSS